MATEQAVAEVVSAHLDCQWQGGTTLDCGAEFPSATSRDFRAAHVAERLAAAGLVATAAHDDWVAGVTLHEAADEGPPTETATVSEVRAWLHARAARIDGGVPASTWSRGLPSNHSRP